MPSNASASSGLRSLMHPANGVLLRLLDHLPAAGLAAAGWREPLITAADSLLAAEAPESRLVARDLRKALLREVLEGLIPRRQPAAALPEAMAVGPGPTTVGMSVPGEADLREIGFRGFTARIADGVEESSGMAILREKLGDKIALEAFPSLPRYWTIRFTGADKPLVSEAWEVARQIEQTGKFTYVEPNLAVPAFPEPDAPTLESFSGPGDWDRNHPGALADCEWSLKQCSMDALWKHSTGAGVVIGHIDTGYTLHPELKPNLDRTRDWNFWEGNADAQDPLRGGFWDEWRTKSPVLNPGHGTGTGSVIVSPRGKQATTFGSAWVSGTAPKATLIPYRATPAVVILPMGSQDEVARAIVRACEDGADVISMSLGSPWASQLLRDALTHALDAGVIVCAAAGNVVAGWIQGDGVTYPAKFPGVVAVAACDFDRVPWKHSCRGPEVNITAPGTDVWRAVATKDLNRAVVMGGSGTSFAVATVAGAAACWVGRHGGRKALRHRYGDQPRLVPAAFLHCLRLHAKHPLAGGNPNLFGGGVLNAEALADFPLPSAQELAPLAGALVPPPSFGLETMASLFPAETDPRLLESYYYSQALSDPVGRNESEFSELAHHVATQPALLTRWRTALAGANRPGETVGINASPTNFSARMLPFSADWDVRSTLGLGLSRSHGSFEAGSAAAHAASRVASDHEAAPALSPAPGQETAPAAPPLKHVIAYCLHETETHLAETLMNPDSAPEKRDRAVLVTTPSFVMGQASDSEIDQMRASKLVVRELAAPVVPPAGDARVFSAEELGMPHRFRLHLVGPMMPKRREEITGQGIRIIEFLPGGDYLVEATPAQADMVRHFPYVSRIVPEAGGATSELRSFDMPAAFSQPVFSPNNPEAVMPQPYDLWLDEKTDAADFAAELRRQGYQVDAVAGRKMRVLLAPGSAQARTLAAMPAVNGNLEKYVPPSLHLNHARGLIGLAAAGTAPHGLPWTGDGQTIAIADTGIDSNHPDLKIRFLPWSRWAGPTRPTTPAATARTWLGRPWATAARPAGRSSARLRKPSSISNRSWGNRP